jgi:hypothetical protein
MAVCIWNASMRRSRIRAVCQRCSWIVRPNHDAENMNRHCERSEAIQNPQARTGLPRRFAPRNDDLNAKFIQNSNGEVSFWKINSRLHVEFEKCHNQICERFPPTLVQIRIPGRNHIKNQSLIWSHRSHKADHLYNVVAQNIHQKSLRLSKVR